MCWWCGLELAVLLILLSDQLPKILVLVVIRRTSVPVVIHRTSILVLVRSLFAALLKGLPRLRRILPPKVAKMAELLRSQYPANSEFIGKTNTGYVGLRLLELVEAGLDLILVDTVGIDRGIEGLIRRADAALSLVDQRLALLIDLPYLSELIRV